MCCGVNNTGSLSKLTKITKAVGLTDAVNYDRCTDLCLFLFLSPPEDMGRNVIFGVLAAVGPES